MRYLKTAILVALIPMMMGSGTRDVKFTEGIQPGNLAPTIQLQDVSLKSGGYILLQFWAAYDAESRAQNVSMHQAISRLNADNLRLISISLDEKKSVFDGTVQADGLHVETQLNESKGKRSELFRAYQLKKGFGNWLIDSQGVIVARNVKPSEIAEVVQARKS